MPWTRMRFRNALVWVKVDDRGALDLDGNGRAEMRYRLDDPRSYRPHPSNLSPAGGEGEAQPPSSTQTVPDQSTTTRKKSPGTRSPTDTAPLDSTPTSSQIIAVWTDGACTGNPGPMGIGIVILAGDRRIEHGEFLGYGTNNVAELVAIQRGLELVEHHFPNAQSDSQTEIRVYTDSGYGIGVLSLGWKAKANRELIAKLRACLARFSRLRFEKVTGHAGVPENERCDQLARQAIAQKH